MSLINHPFDQGVETIYPSPVRHDIQFGAGFRQFPLLNHPTITITSAEPLNSFIS